jgi:YD repeat-containing protein
MSPPRTFWKPPLWKWGVALFSFGIFVWLLWHKPAQPAQERVKVELLPFSDSPPAWDGSYPYLVISQVNGSPLKFNAAISLTKPTVHHNSPVNEFAVDLHTGRFVLRQTDLFVPDVMPLSLTRTYIAWDYHVRAFGVGTNHPYDICPTGTRLPYTYMDLNLEDFYQVHMPRISKGTGYADAVFRHSETSSEFYGAQVAWNGNGWTLTFRDGSKFYFPEAYNAKSLAQGAAIAMVDARGNRIQLRRNAVRNLEELISPAGHKVAFSYDDLNRITQAQDDAGNVRKYSYDTTGHLETVSDANSILYRFEYAPLMSEAGFDPWLLTGVFDEKGNVILHNNYKWGRVVEQQLGNGAVYRYQYQLADREVTQSTVTFPTGEKEILSFRGGMLVDQKSEKQNR